MKKDFISKDMKLISRFLVLLFIGFLAYKVTSIDYIKEFDEKTVTSLNVVVGAVFGALTLVINFHFSSKIEDNKDKDK